MRPLILALLLSGCAAQPVTKEVQVPVPIPCINADQVPPVVPNAKDQLRKSDPAGVKIKAVLIERERLRKTDTEFRALVQQCIK